jgi:hypothetical protein
MSVTGRLGDGRGGLLREAAFFEALSKDRTESADTLEKPSMRGVKTGIVEKYSDQAHFIYELIQNADDAGATSARFDLRDKELIFAHNGTRRFSVSNPETEDDDTNNGKLGDINSITSIANSNKTAASIGKFGVGFKAVFQYTQRPGIYDPNFRFMIDRFIVPVKIEYDFGGRNPDETLFVFPFNHPDRNHDEAYKDISVKMCSLIFPVLFLNTLERISCSFQKESKTYMKSYTKSIEEKHNFDGIVEELVSLKKNTKDFLVENQLWLFTRTSEEKLSYSVGFSLNNDGKLTKNNFDAFCFFPTKEVTGLNFIIHAPFLLNDAREGIKAGEQHNKNMIALLAKLAADSLIYLRDLGEQKGIALIDDSIIDIIPYDANQFNNVNDGNKISFMPFYTAIKAKFASEELLPCNDGFTRKNNAYWADINRLTETFSNDQLATLTGNINAKWVFVSYQTRNTDPIKKEYIKFFVSEITEESDIVKLITGTFIEKQPIEWLHTFYQFVSENTRRKNLIKTKPVFLNQDNRAVAAFDEGGQTILFLPQDDNSGYETVNAVLLENPNTKKIIEELGIKEPSLKDNIYNKILPLYKGKVVADTNAHFKIFFQYYKKCPRGEVDSFIDLLKDCKFVLFQMANDEKINRLEKANILYFPDELLKKWFQAKLDTKFVAFDEYVQLVGEENTAELYEFLYALGVSKSVKMLSRELSEEQAYKIKPEHEWLQHSHFYTSERKWIDKYLDGSKKIFENMNPENSIIVWEVLLDLIDKKQFDNFVKGEYTYWYNDRGGEKSSLDSFESNEARYLCTKPWLLNADGALVSASEVTLQTLSPQYDRSSGAALELI